MGCSENLPRVETFEVSDWKKLKYISKDGLKKTSSFKLNIALGDISMIY